MRVTEKRLKRIKLYFIGVLVSGMMGCGMTSEYRQFFGYLGDKDSGIYDIERGYDGRFSFETRGELNENVVVYFYLYTDDAAMGSTLNLHIKITNNHKKIIKFEGFEDELFIVDETGHQYEFDLMQASYSDLKNINPRSTAETTISIPVESNFKLSTFKHVKWKLGLMNSWVEGSFIPDET